MFNLRFGPGSSTAISSTAVLATFDSSNPVSSTNDFKVRLASISILHFLFDLLKIFYGQG